MPCKKNSHQPFLKPARVSFDDTHGDKPIENTPVLQRHHVTDKNLAQRRDATSAHSLHRYERKKERKVLAQFLCQIGVCFH